MKIPESILTWIIRFYPPLFFQGIWVRRFHKGYRQVDVTIRKSIFNRNSNGSIFGGTIFSATDPFYALLFEQLIVREGFQPIVWLKSAGIEYRKPGRTNLHFTINISDADLAEALNALRNDGRFVKTFEIEVFDKHGELCASASNEVYIKIK